MTDVDHPIFSIDCKLRKNFSLSDFDKLTANASKHNKIPVLAYRKPGPGKKPTYCVLDFDTFVSLAKGAEWLNMDAIEGSEMDAGAAAGKWPQGEQQAI